MNEGLPEEPANQQNGEKEAEQAIPITEDSDPKKPGFLPEVLDRTVITAPLFEEFKKHKGVHSIIIDINLLYHAGREEAKAEVQRLIIKILKEFPGKNEGQGIHSVKTKFSQQYVFAVLQQEVIQQLVRLDGSRTNPENKQPSSLQAIFHIWPDFEIQQLTTRSVSTVKADAVLKFTGFINFIGIAGAIAKTPALRVTDDIFRLSISSISIAKPPASNELKEAAEPTPGIAWGPRNISPVAEKALRRIMCFSFMIACFIEIYPNLILHQ